MAEKIKICSFNLRCETADDGINQFSHGRCDRVIELIRNESPDVIGFQEMTESMYAFLRDRLSEYSFFGCGREKDYSGEATAIAVKNDGFSVISYETFWLSFTPNVPGSTFGVDQSPCPRTATSLLIHHVGERARILGITAIMEHISKFPEKFVLTGDFNAEPDSAVVAALNGMEHFGNTVRELTEKVGGTFHGYGTLEVPPKIDYIFSDADYEPAESKLVAYPPINGVYVSDHHPVFATIII